MLLGVLKFGVGTRLNTAFAGIYTIKRINKKLSNIMFRWRKEKNMKDIQFCIYTSCDLRTIKAILSIIIWYK